MNLIPAFVASQLAIPGMIEKGFGLIGLTHSYASMLARFEDITANAIAPALIETEMIKNNPKIRPDLIPVGRFGQPGEVASVVLMLVRNGYITAEKA